MPTSLDKGRFSFPVPDCVPKVPITTTSARLLAQILFGSALRRQLQGGEDDLIVQILDLLFRAEGVDCRHYLARQGMLGFRHQVQRHGAVVA